MGPVRLIDLREVREKLNLIGQVLIIADGSGTRQENPQGWCGILYDLRQDPFGFIRSKVITGGASTGTTGTAELMPVFQTLYWYDANIRRNETQRRNAPPITVDILTDNQTIALQGNGRARSQHLDPLWSAIRFLAGLPLASRTKMEGGRVLEGMFGSVYSLMFHHVHRDTVGPHALADHLARCARLRAGELTVASCLKMKVPDDLA